MSPDDRMLDVPEYDSMLEEVERDRFRLERMLEERENMLATVERDAYRFERTLTELAAEGNERAAEVLREAELDYP